MSELQTPYAVVSGQYRFYRADGKEMVPYAKQLAAMNALSPLPRSGVYGEVGTGKTFISTVQALYKLMISGSVTIVLMPPILLDMWQRWLNRIQPSPSNTLYRGTPKVRAQMEITAAEFVLMSIQIFKNDFEYLCGLYEHRNVTLIVDEATSIKNVGSQNYRRVRDFVNG